VRRSLGLNGEVSFLTGCHDSDSDVSSYRVGGRGGTKSFSLAARVESPGARRTRAHVPVHPSQLTSMFRTVAYPFALVHVQIVCVRS
jgi:hypothetical protein